MTTLTIKNLPMDNILDRRAMAALCGGLGMHNPAASASPAWGDLFNLVYDWWSSGGSDDWTVNLGAAPAPASAAPATGPLTGSISGSLPGYTH